MKEPKGVGLKTGALKLNDCIMMAIGGMVGSAIYSLSGVTYSLAGPAAVLSWIISGVITLIYAMNVAELATIYPKSGGVYIYPYEVLGRTNGQKSFWGWFTAWSRLASVIGGAAFSAIYVSYYLKALIPAAENYQVLLGVLAVIVCWLLNILGVKLLSRINKGLTATLMTISVIFIIMCLPKFNVAHFRPFFGQGTAGTQGFLASIPISMVAYGSILAIASVAEEIENPQVNIPKATGYSAFATIAMYTLMLLATFGLVPASSFADNHFAMYAPMDFAIVQAMPQHIWLSKLISIGAFLALMTTILILVMESGRIVMASAKLGLLPKSLANINEKTNIPTNALTLCSLVTAIIAAFPQFTQTIINSGAFCSGVVVIMIVITLIVNRSKKVTVPGAFRTPGGLLFPIISLIIVVLTLTQLEASSFVVTAWWYVVGLVIFLLGYLFSIKRLEQSGISDSISK
ncbi:MAG: amino acid permease [Thermoanaerobacterales bacterium]|nr:amino acid permease [Thermoanaerobacterales bacterium]